MRKHVLVLCVFAIMPGCAAPRAVQRIGVDYNSAIAGMVDEIALLNIVRAKEDLPIHYTSLSRLSGSLIVRGSAGVNNQFKSDARTGTVADTTTSAPSGTSVVQAITSQIASGGNVLTPSITGEVTTGPSFDVAIFDSQKFYQGVLGPIPFSTLESYLDLDYDGELLMRLLVERIEYRAKADQPGIVKGSLIKTLRNVPEGPAALEFATEANCYELRGENFRRAPTPLAAASRVTRGPDGRPVPVPLSELALLDGKVYDLTAPLQASPAGDAAVNIQRVYEDRRVLRLVPKKTCQIPLPLNAKENAEVVIREVGEMPAYPPAEAFYAGEGKTTVTVGTDGEKKQVEVDSDLTIHLRSTEGVIRFLGRYLKAAEKSPASTYRLGTAPLFSVSTGAGRGAVETTLRGQRYFVADAPLEARRRNTKILSLVEQLINLHKESVDRPATRAVQVIP